MPRFSQTAYSLATDPSSRAALVDRLAAFAAGIANGTITQAWLDRMDAAITTRQARVAVATYQNEGLASLAAANQILADSGALAADDYEVLVTMSRTAIGAASVNGQVHLQHRDAANAANVREIIFIAVQGNAAGVTEFDSPHLPWKRITLAANERIRLIKGSADAVGASTTWSLQIRKAQGVGT